MPGTQSARKRAADSPKAEGPLRVAEQDQPIGGRNTGVVAVATTGSRDGTAGTVTSWCCAANGIAGVIATTGNTQAQAQPKPCAQSHSSWAVPSPLVDASSSHSLSIAALASCWPATPAVVTWCALSTAMELAAHTDRLPSRQNVTISRKRSRTRRAGIGRSIEIPGCLYHEITRRKTACQLRIGFAATWITTGDSVSSVSCIDMRCSAP